MGDLQLIPTERKALQALQRQIASQWPGARLTLFGSYVHGTADPESDLDILIELPEPVTPAIRRRIVHLVFDLNLEYGTNISILLVSQDEWDDGTLSVTPIHSIIASEGIPL